MAGHGFIHDKLEIKFLILYIAARVIEPVPFSAMLELSLCDDAIGYFDFSDCLADLVKTQHLTLSDEGLYAITDKGRRNSEICESNLPYSVRQRCDKNLTDCNRRLRRKSQVRASSVRRPNGTWTVSLSLADDMGSVMDLNLMMVREDMAQAVEKRFRQSPERLYGQIVNLLLSDSPPKAPAEQAEEDRRGEQGEPLQAGKAGERGETPGTGGPDEPGETSAEPNEIEP